MPEITVHAIVLRRRDSGENDRRLTLLTRELGKIDVVAKGARKSGSRLAGSSDPLAVAEFSIATGKANRFITQAQPVASFRGLRTDYERLSFALALCELHSAILPWEEPSPEAYDLLARCLGELEGHTKPLVAMVWAEIQLLALSGFLPAFDRSCLDGEPVKEAQPWVSAHAGGYVSDADALRFTDRVRTRAEVLYGLARTAELEEPPPNLKFADECLGVLLLFWRQIAEAPLPANESCVAEVRHG
ncbi:MAG TPA: DNA repair protein RecO [Fimbriimonadaceae bacterium]|nr:DNA repair protein RecO [Fimbriimonadaceae bacterium]